MWTYYRAGIYQSKVICAIQPTRLQDKSGVISKNSASLLDSLKRLGKLNHCFKPNNALANVVHIALNLN